MSNPSRISKQLSSDLSKALKDVASQSGMMDIALQRRLKVAVEDLERSLRHYDRLAQGLVSQTPPLDQLEKVIHDRVPSDYRNKAYKRLFWRTVYRAVPFLRQKKKTEDEINSASRDALSLFSVVFRATVGYSNALLAVLSQVSEEELTEDPEEFDKELEGTLLGLEKAVLPSEGKDAHQRKTNENISKKQKGKKPSSGVTSEEEFQGYISSHESVLAGPKAVFSRYSKNLQELLTHSSERTFSLIHQSTLKAAALGQVYVAIASSSRKALQPGTYVAATAFVSLITSVNNAVIQSIATNRAQRKEINQRLKDLQKGQPSQKNDTQEEEESW